MIIERRIKINNVNYFLGIEVKYNNNGGLVRKNNDYFDCGDLTKLISQVEKEYEKSYIYEKNISYMNDVIYLYDRFPFIEYIKDVSYGIDNQICEICIIKREEIEDYIKNNNIKGSRYNKKAFF